jgi:DASH complex subunit DAD2
MSYPTRSLSSHMRATSTSASTGAQSPALVARIEEKKAELANLKELRELSAAVATQMEALEQKLSTLTDGTEGALGIYHF